MAARIPDRPVRWLAGVCSVLLVAEFLVDRHPHVPGEGLPWFYAIVGFVAFTLITLGAKSLARRVRRPENFYGDAAVDAEDYPWRGLGLRESGRSAHAPDGPGDGAPPSATGDASGRGTGAPGSATSHVDRP